MGSKNCQRNGATNVRWFILVLLIGFTFQGHFNRVSISVAGSERFIGDGKLSEQQMGFVYSAFLLVYTVAMLPGGWVIDRVGPRWALTGMGWGMGTFVTLTGIIGWFGLPIHSLLGPLIVIRGIAGGLSAPLHPGTSRAITLWLPLTGRLTGNGLVTAGALTGIAFTYPTFGRLLDWYDWPLAFVSCGLVFITFTTFWHLVSADSPHMHTWSNSAERDLLGSRYSTARYRATMADLFAMLGNSHLVCVALSYAALGYFQYLFFYWIGYYFTDTLHLPKDQSRDATFTVTISMAIGMAIGGWLSAALCRYCRYRQACRAIALLGMGLSGVFAWLGAFASEPRAVVVAFSVAMASLGACESVFWTTASLLEPRRGGLAAAFINTGSNAGGLIAPSLTPWIANNYGWTMAITVASIICGGGGLIWLLIDPEAESQE